MEAENRVLYAEKAHLSTSDWRFPKREYNILSSSELGQKGIGAQQLFDSKCRRRLLVYVYNAVKHEGSCRPMPLYSRGRTRSFPQALSGYTPPAEAPHRNRGEG